MLVLNVNFNEETLPLCSESKYLGKSSESHVSPTLQATSQKLTSNPSLLRWIAGYGWGNNAANNHLSPGPFNSTLLRSCLVS